MNETSFDTTTLSRIVFIPAALRACNISDSMFIHLNRDIIKGAAIFIERDDLYLGIEYTIFSRCSSVQQGGSIFLNGNIHSNLSFVTFFECKSQQGLAAYINKGIVELEFSMMCPDRVLKGSQEFPIYLEI